MLISDRENAGILRIRFGYEIIEIHNRVTGLVPPQSPTGPYTARGSHLEIVATGLICGGEFCCQTEPELSEFDLLRPLLGEIVEGIQTMDCGPEFRIEGMLTQIGTEIRIVLTRPIVFLKTSAG